MSHASKHARGVASGRMSKMLSPRGRSGSGRTPVLTAPASCRGVLGMSTTTTLVITSEGTFIYGRHEVPLTAIQLAAYEPSTCAVSIKLSHQSKAMQFTLTTPDACRTLCETFAELLDGIDRVAGVNLEEGPSPAVAPELHARDDRQVRSADGAEKQGGGPTGVSPGHIQLQPVPSAAPKRAGGDDPATHGYRAHGASGYRVYGASWCVDLLDRGQAELWATKVRGGLRYGWCCVHYPFEAAIFGVLIPLLAAVRFFTVASGLGDEVLP